MTPIAWIIVAAVVSVAAIVVILVLRKTHKWVDETTRVTWAALAAISDTVTAIDDFAAEDHRTMESLDSSNVFAGTAGRARLRGLEVYRNGYVTKHQAKIHASLQRYNDQMRAYATQINKPISEPSSFNLMETFERDHT